MTKEINKIKKKHPPVVVILPVYRNIPITILCINSAMPGILEFDNSIMLIINDASPDDGMQEALEKVSHHWGKKTHLIKNEKNIGFVKTVNKGMLKYPDHDVVLLNSDVVTPKSWLSTLLKDAHKNRKTATVTPLSNATTICTFPDFFQNNGLPYGLDVQATNDAFSKKTLKCISAPTGVGFCMYIKRKIINEIGRFNENEFQKGYGEEVDFCQRALKKDYFNLITPNLYVYHKGGVSFGKEKGELMKKSEKTIARLHPSYQKNAEKFILEDPLRNSRIYRHLQVIADIDKPKILHIGHGLGGGVNQHISEMVDFYEGKAISLILVPHGDSQTVKLTMGGSDKSDTILYKMPQQKDALVELLMFLKVSLIHYHHVLKLNDALIDLPNIIKVPHILTVHDYYLISANPTLSDENGQYKKGKIDVKNSIYSLPEGTSSKQWRDKYRNLVEAAKLVIFPSVYCQKIFMDFFNPQKAIATPHPEPNRNIKEAVNPITKKNVYTIGVIGAINKEKGADLIEAVAKSALGSKIKIQFVIIGYAYRSLQKVITTGPYRVEDLNEIIKSNSIDVAFFPATWPETYSYTLSYAMHAKLPIFASNIGAFPERLSGRKRSQLYDFDLKPSQILKELTAFIEKERNQKEEDSFVSQESCCDFYENQYIDLCQEPKRKEVELTQYEFGIEQINYPKWKSALLLSLWNAYNHQVFKKAFFFLYNPFVKKALKKMIRTDMNNILRQHKSW